MTEELKNDIKEAIAKLVMNLYQYDDEIIHLANLGFTSPNQYQYLVCCIEGVDIYGKDRESFGLWDKFYEEVSYEEAIEAAKATGECLQIFMPFITDRNSGDIISFFEGVDKDRMEKLIWFVNGTIDFGNYTPRLDIPALLTESRAAALTRELPNKSRGHTELQKL